MEKIYDRKHRFYSSPAAVVLSTEFCDWLEYNNFFTAPASTKYHGNYEGGLFDHSLLL